MHSPIFNRAPEVSGLVVSAIRNTGRHLEWSYFHPDDCTVNARHIRVKFDPDGRSSSSTSIVENSLPVGSSGWFMPRPTSLEDVIDSVRSDRDAYLRTPGRLHGTESERAVARTCIEAGFFHPGTFKDAWTMPGNDPMVVFYIRKPRFDHECDDGQFLVTDGNGPIDEDGPVEAGAALWTGTHRLSVLAPSLEEAIHIIRAGEVRPQHGTPNPGIPRIIPMYSLQWGRENPELSSIGRSHKVR